MREILFRGKRTDNGEWVYGYYVCLNRDLHRIYTGYAETDCSAYYPEFYEVIPETVGQYIGVTDKNGKKIFEGDIVKFGESIGIIYYDEGCFCVKPNKPYWSRISNPAIDIVMNEYPNEIEVVGNIHDKPELLKGGC